MNNIKKYPVTYTLLALCILTYIGTTLLFSMDMNAMQGLACGGFNPYYVQVLEFAKEEGSDVVPICAKIEAELVA